MLNNKKRLLLVCFAAFISQAQAEVLVILPESGPMARAASSIKSGFMSAYALSEDQVPLKFINSDKKSIKTILAKNLNKKTQLIVGPLAKNEVEQIVALNPNVRVLALNEVEQQAPNVIQFSLAKQDDAYALKQILLKDKVSQLLVLRQTGHEQESDLYLMSVMSQLGQSAQMVQDVPKKLKKGQGLLLLGDDAWVNQLSNLPKNNVYAQPTTIEENQPIPEGLKFCDIPALYEHKWNDVAHAYLQQPVSMPYQRLIAFGADAWMLSELYLKTPKIQNFTLEGRTGDLDVNSQRVTRIPHCYQKQKKYHLTTLVINQFMTMNHHHALGQWAEQQALRVLQQQGFQLIKQNFHSRFGELDLIVERGNELIFVEVKARSKGSYGQASEMIRPSQQRKIIRTAEYFLICHPAYEQFYCRFDVICFDFPQKIAKTVQQDFSKLRYDQQWIENAFTL